VAKAEGNVPLETLPLIWEDNIAPDLKEVRCDGLEWINLAQDTNKNGALLNMVM
jgi:hypothetical protein